MTCRLSFYLFLAGVFAFLTIPRMAQPGMFIDGVTYAAIARNLADGTGSFWVPSYTATLHPQFHEHPPLGFALQGAAFAIFGDHLAVERAYSFVVGLLTATLMVAIWRSSLADREYDWLPVAFWLLPSAVTWSIVNNMLENTQTMFTTAAAFAFVQSLRRSRAWWLWSALAGGAIVAAVLTKGFNGLFPLAAPAIAAVVLSRHRQQAWKSGVAMCAGTSVIGAVTLMPHTARSAFRQYVDQQVIASLAGSRGGGRWISLMRHLTGGVIVRMGGLSLLTWVYTRARRIPPHEGHQSALPWGWFFLLLALAGSLPVAFSPRISGHYLLPSMPIYALAFATFTRSLLGTAVDRWQGRPAIPTAITGSALCLFAAALVLPLSGRTLEPRDVEWVSQVRALAPSIPRGDTIPSCDAARDAWGLHAYLQRFYKVSLDPGGSARSRRFLVLGDRPCPVPEDCRYLSGGDRVSLLECAR